MSVKHAKDLSARGIARDLMTTYNANGPVLADRLVLVDAEGRELAGWSELGLSSRLRKHFNGELPCESEVQRLNEDEYLSR